MKTLPFNNIYEFKQFLSGQVYTIREENEFKLHGTYQVTSNYASPQESLFGQVMQVIKIKLTEYGNQVTSEPSYILNPYVIDSGFDNPNEWLDVVKGYCSQIPQSSVSQIATKTFDLLLVKKI